MGGACCKSRDNKVINPEPVSTVDSKVLFRNARVGDINEDYKMGEIFHTSDYGICRVA